ncbi:MAG: SUMF1/EgtB/PvdO family nonheme iron enzyme [Spirochaetes bacterium]|nr:SUMF1/EgtB/PvdO family nonheme iron enzyme [Spirochaetota bacterium]
MPVRYLFIFLIFTFACTQKARACDKQIPGMACIPAGEFIRGSNDHEADEKPAEKVYISQFYIDLTEVTNKAFNECIAAGKCRDCLKTGKCKEIGARYGWRYKKDDQPVSGVSWFTAKEYCEFRRKRLPTEAEWEKAARGPNGNIYPWGNETATCKQAIIQIGEGKSAIKGCFSKRLEPEWHMHTANVASRPAGVYGLYDMAGNVHEWVNDWYEESYAKCGDKCRGRDPKGPCDGADSCPGYRMRSVRGGSWWWTAPYARGSKRRANSPGNFPAVDYHHFGFRCAQSD